MKIESIHVKNFLSHSDTTINFNDHPLWLVVGHNGAGKSALFDAVEFALYGNHRGGNRQMFQHLIKNQQEEAEIVIVFQHARQRYQATRKLRRSRHKNADVNVGGSLKLYSNGEWQIVAGVGKDKQAVWNYVEQKIMSHELFTSTVYLKQGAIDFFLQGNSKDRAKRFAQLMNLEEYTQLSEAAQKHEEQENYEASLRAGDLESLGDVSDNALQELEKQLNDLEEETKSYKKEVETLEKKYANAVLWADKTQQIDELERQLRDLRALLEQSDEIIAASKFVRGWGTVLSDLQRFWENYDKAREFSELSQQAEDDAKQKEKEAVDRQCGCDTLQKQLDSLLDIELPQAKQALEEATRKLDMIGLEKNIAVQVANLQQAWEHLERLAGAEMAFELWRSQQRAIPRLRAVVDAKDNLRKLEEERLQAREGEASSRKAEKESFEALEITRQALGKASSAYSQAQEHAKEIERQITALGGEIEEHRRLGGEEGKCPVCDQELDEPAHAHIQKVIQDKQAILDAERSNLEAVQSEVENMRLGLEKAKDTEQKASEVYVQRQEARRKTEGSISTLDARINMAQATYDRVLKDVETEVPTYINVISEFDQVKLDALVAEVKAQESRVNADFQTFQQAQTQYSRAQAQLDALRGQRDPDLIEGLGEIEVVETLNQRITSLENEKDKLKRKLLEFKKNNQQLSEQVNQCNIDIAILEARAEYLYAQADQARQNAERAQEVAKSIVVLKDWQDCITDRQTYHSRRDEVQRLRTTAEKIEELRTAEGKSSVIQKQLKEFDNQRRVIPETHRGDPAEVKTRLGIARSERDRCINQQTQAVEEFRKLKDLQQRAEELSAQQQKAQQRAETFKQLARLLGPDGDIQLSVTASVQEEICQQANHILNQIGDGLEIRLSKPRRGGDPALDVVVIDRRDPASGSRYYEFLSGGEQFRVGLAVALATHFRATGRSAGTVIVDEGFGALDSERRAAIAEQIVNVSDGLLSNKLVEQLIITTHVDEVKHYFPHRWEITKRDGVANAKRVSQG